MNEKGITDSFVRKNLEKLNLLFDEQKSSSTIISESLKHSSKSGKGGCGNPEFFVYYQKLDNVLIIIEDKFSNDKLIKYNENNEIDLSLGLKSAVSLYAVNGAVHYSYVIADKCSKYKTIIAIGVTGDERNHNIFAYAIIKQSGRIIKKPLGHWYNFEMLREENISDYIDKYVYNKPTPAELEEKKIIKIANELNEDMRKYAQAQEHWKPLIISGIVLALKNDSFRKTYEILLKGSEDPKEYDGIEIYNAIEKTLNKSSAELRSKIETILLEFSFLKTDLNLNQINNDLKETPLKYIVRKVEEEVYQTLAKNKFDILGKFYSRFLKYASGSDSSGLGIVLTPNHITEAFCHLANLTKDDTVLDICCGTAGFLVSAMNYLENIIDSDNSIPIEEKEVKKGLMKKKQLFGVENKSNLFTIAATNMILRGDGKTNMIYNDCFKVSKNQLNKKITVGMINPPYSQAKKLKDSKFSEWNFILHLLGLVETGGTVVAIVPLAVPIGQEEYEKNYKKEFLSKHTLKSVITMPGELFYPVGTHTCIMIMEANKPHDMNSRVKFINFNDDGCIKHKTLGRITTQKTEEKLQFLYDVYFDRIDADNSIIIKEKLGTEFPDEPWLEEWVYSYHYFDNKIPDDIVFEQKLLEYIKFKTNQCLDGRNYLFNKE
ncbi:MAG: N-6 DNA methylase [Staphylococcus sp.]|nr:N-6 DNA methylase [Staphylococcus sp.]